MKLSLLFSAVTVAATVLACSFVGQAADSPDLVNAGTVRVEGADGTPLAGVHVHQEGEILKVWGMFSSAPLPGHVDVTVMDPDRKILAETRAIPDRITRTRTRGSRWRFDAKLPVTPPPGAIVKVEPGFGKHKTSTEATPPTNGEQ